MQIYQKDDDIYLLTFSTDLASRSFGTGYSRLQQHLTRFQVDTIQSEDIKRDPEMDKSAVWAGLGCMAVFPISGSHLISPPGREVEYEKG